MKYKIVFDRENCVGAAPCIEEWGKMSMGDDNKAVLAGASETPEGFVMEIDEAEYESALAAAQSCPVNVIHIFNAESGDKII